MNQNRTFHFMALAAGAALSALPTSGTAAGVRERQPLSSAPTYDARGAKQALYVSNLDGQILVYSTDMVSNPQLLRTITVGAPRPFGIWVDRMGMLYVINQYSSAGPASVAEYKRGASTPFLTITNSLNSPAAVAVDSSGSVYVNQVVQLQDGTHDAIVVYPPGGVTPVRTITLPLTGYALAPGQMVFDRAGNLLVSFAFFVSGAKLEAHVFRILPGAAKGKDLGLQGLGGNALAIDGAGNLYGGDGSEGGPSGISVYPPHSKVPSRTISVPFNGYFMSAARNGTLYVAGYLDEAVVGEYLPGAGAPTNIFGIPPNAGSVLVIDAAVGPA